jgi:hypothetical protein
MHESHLGSFAVACFFAPACRVSGDPYKVQWGSRSQQTLFHSVWNNAYPLSYMHPYIMPCTARKSDVRRTWIVWYAHRHKERWTEDENKRFIQALEAESYPPDFIRVGKSH